MAFVIGLALVLLFAFCIYYLNKKEADEPKREKEVLIKTAEALKTYKDLYDQGVLTEEEFEQKKKELLK